LKRLPVVALGWVQAAALAGLYICVGLAVDADHGWSEDRPGIWLVPVMLALVLAAGAAAVVVPYLAARDQALDEARERRRVVAQVFRLGAAQRSRERAGAIVSTATDGVERAAAYRGSFLGPMIGSMTAPLLVLVMMGALVDWVVAGFTAIALPVIPLALGAFQAAFRGVSRRYRENGRVFSAKFLDAIQGLPTLRLMNADRAHGRTLAAAAEELRRHVMRLLAGNQLMLFVVDSLFSLAFIAAVAGLSLWRIDVHAIDPGQGLALVLCGTLLLEPLDRIGQFFYIGMGGIASAKEIKAFLAERPAVADPADADPAGSDRVASDRADADLAGLGRARSGAADPARSGHGVPAATGGAASSNGTAGPGANSVNEADAGNSPDAQPPGGPAAAIEFRAVGFAYGAGPPVLTGFDLAVEPGEHVALVGRSGAGKTTIAELLQGNLRPERGQVRLFGLDVTAVPLKWQRGQMAVVAQHTYLFTGTLRENLLVADPHADAHRLLDALRAADLAEFVHELPDGLDTAVGERGLALSGGQSQRLGIARAFLKDAPVLVLDEPTAHVDLASERAILASLEALGRDKTVLAISHRRATIGHADRIVEVGA
jgi:ABC-type multidrug transport system fused ATPase/permease subunit